MIHESSCYITPTPSPLSRSLTHRLGSPPPPPPPPAPNLPPALKDSLDSLLSSQSTVYNTSPAFVTLGRIIAEVVLNNMASVSAAGEGLAGSQYDATRLSFPAVPYDENDFNNASLCGAKHKVYKEDEKVTPILLSRRE